MVARAARHGSRHMLSPCPTGLPLRHIEQKPPATNGALGNSRSWPKFTARKKYVLSIDAPLVCHAYASVKALGPPEVKRQSWNLRLDVEKGAPSLARP